MTKAVFDSTVLVSAFLTKTGISRDLLSQAQAGSFSICVSEEILNEIERVLLEYPRIRKRYHYSDEAAQAYAALLALDRQNSSQHWMKDRALQIAAELVRMRSQFIEGQGSTISPVTLTVLVLWITVIFASFGFVAPRNSTVVAAFFVCSLSIAAAIYLVLEMDRPLDGLLAIPSEPMRNALAHLSK